MGQMFDITRDDMNNWRWDNPRAFGDQVDRSNPHTTSLGKVQRTCEHFSWHGIDYLSAQIEPPSCRQYKPGDLLALGPLNWDEIIDEDDDDDNWADPCSPRVGRSRPDNGNQNDDGESERDMQGSAKGTGKEQGTKDGRGKGMATEDGKGKRNGKGKGNRKGKAIFRHTPG